MRRGIALAAGVGVLAEAVLLAILTVTRGLGAAAWVVGIVFALVVNGALALGLRRAGASAPTAADGVTLARATLVGGVTALVVEGWFAPVAPSLLASLAAAAWALDAVDGFVARRLGCATPLGARFDMEIDAWLILGLSVAAVPLVGAWVLAIGLMHYALLVAGWVAPWLRADLPPRYWNKVVAALQGAALIVVVARVLPRAAAQGVLVIALALLVESFGHQVACLWRRHVGAPAAAETRRPITPWSAALTVLAGLLLWLVLVIPPRIQWMTAAAWPHAPLVLLALAALALLLPRAARHAVGGVVGVLVGLLVLVKLLDMGFYRAFDRPVDLLSDAYYFGPGYGVLVDTVGHVAAIALMALLALLVLALLVVFPWAVLRLMRAVADRPRAWSARVVGALLTVWVVLAIADVRPAGSPVPVASGNAIALVWQQGTSIHRAIADHRVFAAAIAADPLAATPDACLLQRLRGKDVLLVFIESYGKVAVTGSTFAPGVDAVLTAGTRALEAHGYAMRSGFLVSPTFGGASWLAHSTMESGLWVDSQQRYNQLLTSQRMTLASAFKRAGWRTVADVPADTRAWPQGLRFYGFDQLYNVHNVGYAGPRFSYATMPDQYTLAAFRRLELTPPPRRPVFAEIDFVSSHDPWTPLPHLVPWSAVGDGRVFDPMAQHGLSPTAAFRHPATVQALYGQSVRYSLGALFSYLDTYPDPNLVVIVLGDHQPWEIVSGEHPGHEVPAAVIAQDPAIIARLADWGWQPTMLPGPKAPVWPMSAFRDRFLRAFNGACE